MTTDNLKITTYEVDISCDGPSPYITNVGQHNEVKFINTTGALVTITFDHPGIFSPSHGGTLTLGSGKNKKLRINQIKNGTGFTYPDCDKGIKVRSGRIDPV